MLSCWGKEIQRTLWNESLTLFQCHRELILKQSEFAANDKWTGTQYDTIHSYLSWSLGPNRYKTPLPATPGRSVQLGHNHRFIQLYALVFARQQVETMEPAWTSYWRNAWICMITCLFVLMAVATMDNYGHNLHKLGYSPCNRVTLVWLIVIVFRTCLNWRKANGVVLHDL